MYDDENFEATLKLCIGRALTRHMKTRLRTSGFNVCWGYVNFSKSSQLCHRAGVQRFVKNRIKYYCNDHNAERVRDYNIYKWQSIELSDVFKKDKDELRQYTIKHGRRFRYRLKYNIDHDKGHDTYEGKLYVAYCLHYYVCEHCENDQEVSKSTEKKKNIQLFSNLQKKRKRTESNTAELEQTDFLNNS